MSATNAQSSVDKTIEKIVRKFRKAEREGYTGAINIMTAWRNGGVGTSKCNQETSL